MSRTTLARPDWLVQFGHRLRLARGRAGLTQQRLAAPDLNKSFISLLESARSYPSVETVISLASRLDTSVASLLFDADELRRETAHNLLHLAWLLDPATRGEEALRLADAAGALAGGLPPEMRARAVLVRARVAMAASRLGEAAVAANEAAALARRARHARALGSALALRGVIDERRGQYRAAIATLQRALGIMRRTSSVRSEEGVWALLSLAAAFGRTGQAARARRAYRQALAVATRLHLPRMRGRALTGLGMVEWMLKRLDEAVSVFSQAYAAFEQDEDLPEMARVLSNLGLIRREQGLYAEALAVLERAARLRERQRDARGLAATADETAQVLLAMNRLAEAARAARRAIELGRASGDRSRQAVATMTLGQVLRAQGRRKEAIEHLQAAMVQLRRLGMRPHAAAAQVELDLTRDQRPSGVAATR
ncbi:MAG: transcriptional regulator [Armatimonadota bacterium]|nr:transcriptional regulator [Armatimonadota bacterium]MDR7453823.1 transcriptional regulator [Armatimonadota bacterium]MDR7495914.1 transcriptional regulator [Armatimonadota bacterium]MDR7511837.1 transcriptional regulator [Armatimonadota bacterium]